FSAIPLGRPQTPQPNNEWGHLHGFGGPEPLEIRVEKASEDKTDDSVDFIDPPESAEKEFQREQPPFVKLLVAIWYAILSRSELVSYIMIFVNQMKTASVLSLPLPFMVFLWGSLSVPRPSKTFWISVIAYTEVQVLVKYLFQFDFFPWNQSVILSRPFWPPRILGIEKKNRYAVYDLALLLVIFFHRFMLKSLGLWKESSESPTVSTSSSPYHSSSPSSFSHTHSSSSPHQIITGAYKKEEESLISNQSSKIEEESLISSSSSKRDEESLISNPSSKDTSHFSHSGDASILSYTKDTSLISDTPVGSLDSTPKDISLISNTKDSSTLSNMKEHTYVSIPKESSLISNTIDSSTMSYGKDDRSSLMSKTLESSLPTTTSKGGQMDTSFLSHPHQDISQVTQKCTDQTTISTTSQYQPLSEVPRLRSQSDMPSHRRTGSEIVMHRRTWSPQRKHIRHSSLASHVSENSKSPDNETDHLQVPGGVRHSSLIMKPTHRRHLSEGSRVSFNDQPMSEVTHISHHTHPESMISESVHYGCANINIQMLRDFQKPDMEEMKENFQQLPGIAMNGAEKFVFRVKKFLNALLHPEYQVSVDVYAYMFFCDFFNFFVLIFGFSAFGTSQGDGGVSAYLEENRVPIPFLVMLILQFALIITDRALFLRKYILGKLIFQVVLTFGIHIWMFFILPAVTEREFNAKRPPQIFYMVKCLNLLLSAYQIRCGYPTRILGNFLCKAYNFVNLYSFRMFMNVPFLFELRTLMDWIWTDTSMNLSDWIKMEDVFSHLYQLKCERRAENEYPQNRGENKRKLSKYGMGGCALFGVISLIWFPLVLFALSNTVGKPNPPYEVNLEITVGAYQPIFKMKAQQSSIRILNEREWERLNNRFLTDRLAQTFLGNYDAPDVVVATLSGNSSAIWGISPPAQKRLIADLQGNETIKVMIEWGIKRPSNTPDVVPECKQEKEIDLKAYEGNIRNPVRQNLTQILNGDLSMSVIINDLFPKFVKVTNKGQATFVTQLGDEKKGFIDLQFSLEADGLSVSKKGNRKSVTELMSTQEWWEPHDVGRFTGVHEWELTHIAMPTSAFCKYLSLHVMTFHKKAFHNTSRLFHGRIVGMYTTIVLLASKMLRGYFAGVALKIMFDDMPNVDRILQLCLDIYLVRESKELELEEDLFAKLVFLFRSPETLIKWTRPPEEIDDDEEDADGQLE
ncbi:unnamed protein product, partial [Meganyctiphanes norvegica]